MAQLTSQPVSQIDKQTNTQTDRQIDSHFKLPKTKAIPRVKPLLSEPSERETSATTARQGREEDRGEAGAPTRK